MRLSSPYIPLWPTLMLSLPRQQTILSGILILDLKDACFCIPVPDSQYLFAFEWTDPKTMAHQQYTWTVLPQGFRDSPHLFTRVLEKDLRDLQLQEEAVLQYVDDILICSPSKEASDRNTILTLNFLGGRGYWVSKKKAQISKQRVNYLGYILTPGSRQLSPEIIKAIAELTPPATNGSSALSQEWLGSAGFGFQTLD